MVCLCNSRSEPNLWLAAELPRRANRGSAMFGEADWAHFSAPLCILGKMFVRLCRTTFCV